MKFLYSYFERKYFRFIVESAKHVKGRYLFSHFFAPSIAKVFEK